MKILLEQSSADKHCGGRVHRTSAHYASILHGEEWQAADDKTKHSLAILQKEKTLFAGISFQSGNLEAWSVLLGLH